MMQNPKPAPFNVVSGETTGAAWALPKGAIARLGKGIHRIGPDLDSVALSTDGTYFAAGTGMGLWFYDVSTMLPIALWETEVMVVDPYYGKSHRNINKVSLQSYTQKSIGLNIQTLHGKRLLQH